MEHYVIVYDIRDDRRRNKIYRILKDYATPVQLSVFEAVLTKEKIVQLQYSLKRLMKNEDSIIFYRQCGHCRQDILRLGSTPVPYGEGDIII
ncbi:CRISPR-associated endonuclease Cas2 [Carboxydocella sp. JDF658]|uniref:CRISPR-associated endonuclease Cas2 n=1 Tax=Carboxydocella sp. JDF658 TaxID=1926600 RepID=UPI0009AE0E56|nr:CRISPR-associated endonuclease Cas2 [Carboxydocella sp. JDF658]